MIPCSVILCVKEAMIVSVGIKLRDIRTERGFTQEKVAEELGVSRQTLSNWENEKTYPDILSLIKLSDLYQLTLDELVKGDAMMIKHLDDSTNTVRSNRRLSIITRAGFLILSLILFIPEFFRGNNLESGNVPAGMGGGSGVALAISGPVLFKLMFLVVIAVVLGLVVYLVRLHRRRRTAGDVKWKAVISKKDVICLLALLILLVGAFVILW